MAYKGSDLVKMRLDPPKFGHGKDWELFEYTFTSVIGVTHPEILSMIPGFESHPLAKPIQLPKRPESPTNAPWMSAKKEEEDGEEEEETVVKVEGKDKGKKGESRESTSAQTASAPVTIIPTEQKSEVPVLTGKSRPSPLFALQFGAKYYEHHLREKEARLNITQN